MVIQYQQQNKPSPAFPELLVMLIPLAKQEKILTVAKFLFALLT